MRLDTAYNEGNQAPTKPQTGVFYRYTVNKQINANELIASMPKLDWSQEADQYLKVYNGSLYIV